MDTQRCILFCVFCEETTSEVGLKSKLTATSLFLTPAVDDGQSDEHTDLIVFPWMTEHVSYGCLPSVPSGITQRRWGGGCKYAKQID